MAGQMNYFSRIKILSPGESIISSKKSGIVKCAAPLFTGSIAIGIFNLTTGIEYISILKNEIIDVSKSSSFVMYKDKDDYISVKNNTDQPWTVELTIM